MLEDDKVCVSIATRSMEGFVKGKFQLPGFELRAAYMLIGNMHNGAQLKGRSFLLMAKSFSSRLVFVADGQLAWSFLLTVEIRFGLFFCLW